MARIYVNFGCRLHKSWERYVKVCNGHSNLQIMVNWMHGAAHDMSCQMKNCGRFKEGTAWSVGEQIEQLWSLMKPASKLVKCMTPPNRQDFIEFMLREISR
eukprot:1151123-Pelagomonas_calceolata.AAC.2